MYQLTEATMRCALEKLSERDPLLAGLYDGFGVPSLWSRPESFATLVHIILEQKVSLSSAQAVMTRVCAACPEMLPGDFLALADGVLREAGLSASKESYCRSIAQCLINGSLNLSTLHQLDDTAVIDTLTQVRGIGP